MKKLFVFVLVVSLLAFAGGAWADTDDVLHSLDNIGHGSSSQSNADIAKSYAALAQSLATDSTTVAKGTSALSAVASTSEFYAFRNAIGLTSSQVKGAASTHSTLPTPSVSGTKATEGAFMPPLQGLVSGEVYVIPIAVNTNALYKIRGGTFNPNYLSFYPQGASAKAGTHGTQYKVFCVSGDAPVALTASTIAAGFGGAQWSLSTRPIFITFKFQSSDIGLVAVSDATTGEMTDPVLPVYNSTTPDEVDAEETKATLSSSGGGCAVGTSALALAVLGLFIAKRRG